MIKNTHQKVCSAIIMAATFVSNDQCSNKNNEKNTTSSLNLNDLEKKEKIKNTDNENSHPSSKLANDQKQTNLNKNNYNSDFNLHNHTSQQESSIKSNKTKEIKPLPNNQKSIDSTESYEVNRSKREEEIIKSIKSTGIQNEIRKNKQNLFANLHLSLEVLENFAKLPEETQLAIIQRSRNDAEPNKNLSRSLEGDRHYILTFLKKLDIEVQLAFIEAMHPINNPQYGTSINNQGTKEQYIIRLQELSHLKTTILKQFIALEKELQLALLKPNTDIGTVVLDKYLEHNSIMHLAKLSSKVQKELAHTKIVVAYLDWSTEKILEYSEDQQIKIIKKLEEKNCLGTITPTKIEECI